jgi:predicted HAD superfamily Cof-like phosphohydrolase
MRLTSLEQRVRKFNETYRVPTEPAPKLPLKKQSDLMLSLILEEVQELVAAVEDNDVIEMADALTDIIYVTAQQMYTLGFPVEKLLDEVQRSNMSKLDKNGKAIFGANGKVLKGPNYSKPQIARVLVSHIVNG